MGFLHKLWDETLAGPAPESGLGKLRKYDSFSAAHQRSSPPCEGIAVSRSITIVRKNLNLDSGSPPESPSGSTTPVSPLTPGTPRLGEFKRFTSRKPSPDASDSAESRSPTAYDWILMSALDR
ncbi:hypothetical protein K2173_024651 [Erythroxylum novogranatense]|uniref:Dormancy-associated protein homolog 4 n=1 Tax=Erythroxylum novogranatense TaxID=1862640 RepID=A0AAV8SW76_9ROSI|nr:hypothetical protein K2173_024651 [Erythroxylum novogranatense]